MVARWLILLAVYYLLKKYLIDRKLKYLPILPYGWAVGISALLALAGTLALQPIQLEVLLVFLLLWLIPLLMLRKDVRIWLPTTTRRQVFGKESPMEFPARSGKEITSDNKLLGEKDGLPETESN